MLANEGQQIFLDVVLRGAVAPSQYFLRLFNHEIQKTDTLVNLLGEPVDNGYAPIVVQANEIDWQTLALDDGDFKAETKEFYFEASGGSWGPATHCALCTTANNTGKLVAFKPLSEPRTIKDSERLRVKFSMILKPEVGE